MDSRTSLGVWLIVLGLTCSGCITTQTHKEGVAPSTSSSTDDTADRSKKNVTPKHNPKPGTEIAVGELKEREADAPASKSDPEFQARMRDEARKAYQHALQIDPNCTEASRHLGLLYAKTGDFDRAFDIYQKLLAKHKTNPAIWYEMGLCHNRRKDFHESVNCFRKALEFDPENHVYLKTLGFTLALTGQVEEGFTHLARAEGKALAHYKIAWVMLQRERQEQAEQHLRLALRENPKLEEARTLLRNLQSPQTAVAAGLAGPVVD